MSEISLLRDTLTVLHLPYGSAGMVEVSTGYQVAGKAFFPVGRGLWSDEDLTLSNKKIMVLGQDFGTVEYVEKQVLPFQEEKIKGNPTWNNLHTLLNNVGVKMEDVFFTNAIMGLRAQGSNIDAPTAFKSGAASFLNACQSFFIEQLKIQRPALILTLGYWPIVFLKGLSSILNEKWAGYKSITPLVLNNDAAVVINATFDQLPGFHTNIVSLLHPSMRPVNVSRLSKKYPDKFSPSTESERIKQGIKP